MSETKTPAGFRIYVRRDRLPGPNGYVFVPYNDVVYPTVEEAMRQVDPKLNPGFRWSSTVGGDHWYGGPADPFILDQTNWCVRLADGSEAILADIEHAVLGGHAVWAREKAFLAWLVEDVLVTRNPGWAGRQLDLWFDGEPGPSYISPSSEPKNLTQEDVWNLAWDAVRAQLLLGARNNAHMFSCGGFSPPLGFVIELEADASAVTTEAERLTTLLADWGVEAMVAPWKLAIMHPGERTPLVVFLHDGRDHDFVNAGVDWAVAEGVRREGLSHADFDVVAACRRVTIPPLSRKFGIATLPDGEIDASDREIAEWRASCKEAGLKIDPKTAEVMRVHASAQDPYGVYPDLPRRFQCVGWEYFARAPGSDIWVLFDDLPDETRKALLSHRRSPA